MMLKRLKYIKPVIGILFILVILIISRQAHSGYYSCNDLTSSSFDLNLFNEDSTVNLFRDNRLAKRANRLCLKQLKKDQTNPQFIFQVAFTYLALKEFDEAKKYLDLAIEQEYPAALLYSYLVSDVGWIYEEKYEDNLKKAANSNYIAKYFLAIHSMQDLQDLSMSDREVYLKEKKQILNLLKEIEFFLPVKNIIISIEITENALDYLKIKQLTNEIKINNKIILKKYTLHGPRFIKDILADVSTNLTNYGYANLSIQFMEKRIKIIEEEYLNSGYLVSSDKRWLNLDLAYVYQALGWAYKNTGDISRGQENLMRAIDILQNNSLEEDEDSALLYANILNLLGNTYLDSGFNKEAIKLYKGSLEKYEDLEVRNIWSSMTLGNLGVAIYVDELEFDENEKPIIDTISDEAKLYLQEYWSLINELNLSLVYTYINLSHLVEIYLLEGNIKEAKKIFNKVIKSGVPTQRYNKYLIKFSEAQILIYEKNYEKAKINLLQISSSIEKEELLDFADYFYLKSTLMNLLLFDLDFKSNDEEVSVISNKELEIFTDKILQHIESLEDFNDDRIKEIQAYGDFLLFYLKNKIENKETFDEKAFKIIQLLSMTEIDFTSLSLEYRLTKQNSIEELKQLQILNHDLKILKVNFSFNKDNKNIAESIARVEKEKKLILAKLDITKINNLDFYSYEDFKKVIKPDETFLVFLSGLDNEVLLRIMLQNDQVSMVDLTYELDDIKLYSKKILESTNLSSWPPQDFATLQSHKLFKILFKDIDPERIQKDNLLIKSNGIISILPFNILVKDYDKNPQNYETVSWLVDDNNIINIASFKYFFTNKEQKSIEKTFLGIGNPIFKKQEEEIKVAKINEENILSDIMMSRAAKQRNLVLDALPETEGEVRKISKFFPKTNNKLLLSKKASEGVIKKINLEKYSYIIFATHAIPVSETGNIETSGLALTYPKENTNLDNGFLNSHEIMNLNLNSELVLLSACETATDKKDIGRAFSGLVNSFFFAGTNSVIASHWKIESNSTVQITTEFFKNLIENEMLTAESLRKSILKFKKNNKEFNHPAFWGAFSVTLNARQV